MTEPTKPRLLLWRHGQTDWNIENRFQGHSDIPLNEVGKYQAAHAAEVLRGMNPAKIIVSDLQRAQQTATALSELTGLALITRPGLRETNGGNWEGRTGKENRAADNDRFMDWLAGGDHPAGDTGERRTEVADRAVAVIEEEMVGVEGLLVVVSHGGTIRSVLGKMLNLPTDRWGVLGGLSNASWSILEHYKYGGWSLIEHNAGSIPEPLFGNESVK